MMYSSLKLSDVARRVIVKEMYIFKWRSHRGKLKITISKLCSRERAIVDIKKKIQTEASLDLQLSSASLTSYHCPVPRPPCNPRKLSPCQTKVWHDFFCPDNGSSGQEISLAIQDKSSNTLQFPRYAAVFVEFIS